MWRSFIFVSMIVFRKFSTLEINNNKFGPQTRIIHDIFSLDPVPKVWNPKSRSQSDRNMALCCASVWVMFYF